MHLPPRIANKPLKYCTLLLQIFGNRKVELFQKYSDLFELVHILEVEGSVEESQERVYKLKLKKY